VRRRGTRAAAGLAVAAAVLSLVPLDMAAASKPTHVSPACRAIKREQAAATAAGFAIEKALASANFASAKHQMLRAYNADLANVTRALAIIKSAPPDVRAAFKNLRTYVRQIRNDITGARSVSQLEAELQTLARNPMLEADGTTIANWAASVCGTTVPSSGAG
jgi:hypothetical protein